MTGYLASTKLDHAVASLQTGFDFRPEACHGGQKRFGTAISESNPYEPCARCWSVCQVEEVLILADDDEIVRAREFLDGNILGAAEVDVKHMAAINAAGRL